MRSDPAAPAAASGREQGGRYGQDQIQVVGLCEGGAESLSGLLQGAGRAEKPSDNAQIWGRRRRRGWNAMEFARFGEVFPSDKIVRLRGADGKVKVWEICNDKEDTCRDRFGRDT